MERDISDEIIDKINNDENIDFESGVDIEITITDKGEINQSNTTMIMTKMKMKKIMVKNKKMMITILMLDLRK